MSLHNEPHFLKIFNAVKRKTRHYTPEMHEREAMEHSRMEANTPSDRMWDAFDHMCHAEAHTILANNKRRGLSEMYKFKSNIKKRFWNVLELSESWTSDIMNGAHDRHFEEIDNKLRKLGYKLKKHKESYNPERMVSSWDHLNGGKVTYGVEYRKPNRLTLSYKKEQHEDGHTSYGDGMEAAGVSHDFEVYAPHAYGTTLDVEKQKFGNAKTVFFKKLKRIHTLYESLNEIETKNKIHFVSPWKDELEDLDYTKTIAVTHKIENDGRKNIKKRSGSQVRKQVRARKAKEDSERTSRMLQQIFSPFTRGR
jgi:hypothetical protein